MSYDGRFFFSQNIPRPVHSLHAASIAVQSYRKIKKWRKRPIRYDCDSSIQKGIWREFSFYITLQNIDGIPSFCG